MSIVARLNSAIREKQVELRQALDAFADGAGKTFLTPAPDLPDRLVVDCRLLNSRFAILDLMPKGAVCAEIGVQAGNFAKAISLITRPAKLYLLEIDFSGFDHAAFASQVSDGMVELLEGDSSTSLSNLPDNHLDWVYIDGDHSYNGITRDLRVVSNKVKPEGFIVCNDYCIWSPAEVHEYGVMRGVNEFCIRENWQLVYMGLQGQGYHDVCLRRLP